MDALTAALEHAATQLRGTDNDNKVVALQKLEAQLQDARTSAIAVESRTLEDLASQLKVALRTTNARVALSGLLCAVTYFQLLAEGIASENNISSEGPLRTAVPLLVAPPGVISSLGDARESTRETAARALSHAGSACVQHRSQNHSADAPGDLPLDTLDKLIKEHGFGSKNARTREQCLKYLVVLRTQNPGLPLRTWVSTLVASLEDSDSIVRDVARESVVAIFDMQDVPAAAKADLKRELLKQGVRKSTSDAILKRVLGGPFPSLARSSSTTTSESTDADADTSRVSTTSDRRSSLKTGLQRTSSSVSGSSAGTSKPAARGSGERLLKQPKNLTNAEILAQIEAQAEAAEAVPPSGGEISVQTVYVASTSDLEQEFASMRACFEGKETEHNWQDREKAIFKLRGMIRGDVHNKFYETFARGLKGASEGILKALATLRTTLAIAACSLITELAQAMRQGLDHLYDTLMDALLRMASLTKKTTAQMSQDSVAALMRNCSYHSKTLVLIASVYDQKNVQARIYAVTHLKLFVEVHGKAQKLALENSGHLSLLDGLLRKALSDANSSVRDTARAIFWLVYEIWPKQSSGIMESLDAPGRRLLEKARSQTNGAIAVPRAGPSSSSAPRPNPRPSMRDLISSRRAAQASASHSETPSTSSTPTLSRRSTANATPEVPRERVVSPTGNEARSSPSRLRKISVSSAIPSPSRKRTTSQGTTSSGRERRNEQASTLLAQAAPQAPSVVTQFANSRGEQPSSGEEQIPPSPNLSALGLDYSDIENSTYDLANTVPLPHDASSDDESILMDDRQPKEPSGADRAASKGQAHLDRLLSLPLPGIDPIEVDDAVRGRAEQAEQTAHRFLEVIEPDSEGDETLIIDRDASHTEMSSDSIDAPDGSPPAKTLADGDYAYETPLLKRLQDIHLKDSPANKPPLKPLQASAEDSWWLTKADLQIDRAQLLPLNGNDDMAFIDGLIASVRADSATAIEILQLARLSSDKPHHEEAGQNDFWMADRRFSRLLDGVHQRLHAEGDAHSSDSRMEAYLILLRNIITHQHSLLGGREADVFSDLLAHRRMVNGATSAAAQAIMHVFVQRVEPIYGLSVLQSSLQKHLDQYSAAGSMDVGTAQSFAMALKAFGSFFTQLPSEVLDDQLKLVKVSIQAGLNNTTYPQLRQAAMSAIVQAHNVLEDDQRLFESLGGLTKSQIHLCTYLFAKERGQSAVAAAAAL